MIESVAETISRYNMFPQGGPIGVAVSGGADSVCLLHLLCELAPRWNLRLEVLHLNHKLRGEESEADARFVRELAASRGLPFHLGEAKPTPSKGNVEQAARQARLEFFRSFLRSGALNRIATGHTRSDQAETVLFRILRGTGLTGMAGIRPVTAEGLVRPLIEVSRDDVRSWLRDRGMAWREDSSNADLRLARNRIRQSLLPSLATDWNPRLEQALANLAQVAWDEELHWEGEVERAAADVLRPHAAGVDLDCTKLTQLGPALRRRLARYAISLVRADLRGIEFRHVERFLRLAADAKGKGTIRAPGIEAVRSFGILRLTPGQISVGEYSVALDPPGKAVLADGAAVWLEVLKNSQETPECGYTNSGNDLDWGLVRKLGRLELRSWRPGDRYHPVGLAKPEKVTILFQRARVPSWERSVWPMISIGDQILWSRRFGVAGSLAANAASQEILRVHELAGEPGLGPQASV